MQISFGARHWAVLWIGAVAGVVGYLGGGTTTRDAAHAQSNTMVVVSDDRCVEGAGCDAVSMYRDSSWTDPVFRGPHIYCSPGRLAGSRGLGVVVAQPANSSDAWLVMTRDGDDSWSQKLVSAERMFPMIAAGIALTPDDESIVAAISEGTNNTRSGWWPPYAVYKFALNGFVAGNVSPVATFSGVGDGAPFEILTGADGQANVVHVLTNRGVLFTLSADDLTQVSARVHYGSPPYSRSKIGVLHGSLSGDGRLVATNLPDTGQIAVIDVRARSAARHDVPPGRNDAGPYGVAWRPGADAPQLAIHLGRRVSVVEFRDSALVEVASGDVEEPTGGTVFGTVAWVDSETVLAASSRQEGFSVLKLEDGALVNKGYLTPCVIGEQSPNDVLVGRPAVPPSTATAAPTESPTASLAPTVSPTATGSATASPTADPSAVATGSATPEPPSPSPTRLPSTTHTPTVIASATGTPTVVLTPTATLVPSFPSPSHVTLWLPLAAKEACVVRDDQSADIVLTLDASTSMAEPGAGTDTKWADAVRAAWDFANLVDLSRNRLAIVWFNSTARVEVAPTSDLDVILEGLMRIHLAPQTRLDLGIEAAGRALAGTPPTSGRSRVVVVLSDGRANPVPASVAVDKAALLKQAGVTIYAVGLGRPDDIDSAALSAIASGPSNYYQTADSRQLSALYAQVAARLRCRH